MIKNAPEFFSFPTLAFILKNGPQLSRSLHINCEKTSWTLNNCSLTFVIFGNTRKFCKIFFSTGKIAFFSKNFVFNDHFGVLTVTELIF